MNYTSFVNIKQGTESVPQYSHGNVLPLCAYPFGMSDYSLETRPDASLFFHPTDHATTGIRITHLPSPWLGDYGTLTLSASSGDSAKAKSCIGMRPAAYSHLDALFTPYELGCTLLLYRLRISLTPTRRCSAMRIVWDEKDVAHRFILLNKNGDTHLKIDAANRKITGYTRAHAGYMAHPETFALYFSLTFDRDFDLSDSTAATADRTVLDCSAENDGRGICANIAFARDGRNEVNVRIATSFVSVEQAEQNARAELGELSYDEIRDRCRTEWEKRLSKIEITADDRTMRTFYSCFYRMFLFPRVFHEITADGRKVHYSPACGDIREGVFYTDNGFWDTYKTVYPLYSLIAGDEYRDMCEGFLNYYDEAGWLPRWMSPGALNCMPGTAIDAVFGDAAAKGIVTDEKMLKRMLESTLKHINTPSGCGEYGRDGVESFNSLGYVCSEYNESVNKTQDYAYGNFCVAQIAKALGDKAEEERLLKTAVNYRLLYDADSGFLRARDRKGGMRPDWNMYQWGGDYTEGSAWQNSFACFHDFAGLAALMGGRKKLEEKLDELFDSKPYYDIYGYGEEIHEMVEMASVDFGQCALSNQPSFHIPYMYSCIGAPAKTAYQVRRACAELFNPTECGFPGDEDNGSMSGWYIFSSLGFYPVCPGVAQYVIGSPSVDSAIIHTECGDLTIFARGNSKENVYVGGISLNGKKLHRTYLTQDELCAEGTLIFDMTSDTEKIKKDYYTDDELPYSLEK